MNEMYIRYHMTRLLNEMYLRFQLIGVGTDCYCPHDISYKYAPHWQAYFLAATKQLYEWLSPSICPSVRLSVTPFWLCSHHRIIMKVPGVINNIRSDVHAKGQGQKSKVKVTEVKTQLKRFRTVTPIWIHHNSGELWEVLERKLPPFGHPQSGIIR